MTEVPSPGMNKAAKVAIPRYEAVAKDRIKGVIRAFSKPLESLIARNSNETETRLLITDFLVDALGYDKYEDLDPEYAVKSNFADYGLKIDEQIVAFVEAKRISQALSDRQLRQIQSYAVNEGVEWMFLTNGRVWQIYHLTGGLPVITDLVFEVDLMSSDITMNQKVELLYLISKTGMTKGACHDYWIRHMAASPKAISRAIMTDFIIEEIRKEIRRETKKNIESKEIKSILRDGVLRPGLI